MSGETLIEQIQLAMRAAFPQYEARVAEFYGMQEYHLGWRDLDLQPAHADPGKLLRPQLTLLACAALGGTVAQALPLAAGIQLIHDFSLIHDDIQDQSDTRRGRTTVWTHWGIAQGINAGDGMFVLAHRAIQQLHDEGVPAETVLLVLRRFDETILAVCEGQYLDLSFEGRLEIGEDDYLAMIARKTAALLAAAAGLGGLVAAADAARAEPLFAFGRSLGLAFQVQDDLLGIWGDPAVTGKPAAADLHRRKVSLPVVHALRNAADRERLAQLYRSSQTTPETIAAMLAVLEQAGSRDFCTGIAEQYHQQALQQLDQVVVADSDAARAAHARIRAIAERLPGRTT